MARTYKDMTRYGAERRADTRWRVVRRGMVRRAVLLVALVAIGHAASADERVSIADPELSATVSAALNSARECQAPARAAFGLPREAPPVVVFVAGDLAVCRVSGATSYVRRSIPDRVFVCRAFKDEPAWLRPIIAIHETLHLSGVDDDHNDEQALNRRIATACGFKTERGR